MDPKDPRSYLIRSKNHRVRRTKTSSLPLETPSFAHAGEYAVKDLVQRVRIDISTIETEMTRMPGIESLDEDDGTAFEGFTGEEAER